MFLKSLRIENENGLIRHVEFHEGVNLIVDNSQRRETSGNSVGKTTVLRLIDYCLGGKSKLIWEDREFGTNSEVKQFLVETGVLVTLTLISDLNFRASRSLVIERNFLSRSASILRIDGEKIKKKDFEPILASRLFKHEEDKPSFRQLIAKNLRHDSGRLSHILRVLHQTTSDVEYQTLFLFWFGIIIPDAAAHEKTRQQLRKQETYQKGLAKEISQNSFAVLPDLEKEIAQLSEKRNQLDFPEDYQADLAEFDKLRKSISQRATRLSAVRLRKELVMSSRKKLEADLSQVSTEEIAALYTQAKLLIPDLQKTFEQSVNFHNQMIRNKIDFIERELPQLIDEEKRLQANLAGQQQQAEDFRLRLSKDRTLDALNKLNAELQKLIDRQSRLLEQKRLWEAGEEEYLRLNAMMESFTAAVKNLHQLVDDRLMLFNEFFKKLSQELYGESYALIRKRVDDQGKPQKTIKLSIEGISANPGTGEKKGHITAFDLAYIQFARAHYIPHLNFILHDQIETVDGRQIVTILESLVPQVSAQYVVPMLSDKIPAEIDVEQHAIIELSHEEKLFRF